MAKNKTKNKVFAEEFQYPSVTTDEFCHEQPECFAAELLTYRHAISNGEKMPPFFWRKSVDCNQKYKDEFTENIECTRKLINLGVQPHFIIQCFFYAKGIKYCEYAFIIELVKKRWITWKKNVVKRFIYQVDDMLANKDIMMNISDTAKQIEENGMDFSTTKKSKKIKF